MSSQCIESRETGKEILVRLWLTCGKVLTAAMLNLVRQRLYPCKLGVKKYTLTDAVLLASNSRLYLQLY